MVFVHQLFYSIDDGVIIFVLRSYEAENFQQNVLMYLWSLDVYP